MIRIGRVISPSEIGVANSADDLVRFRVEQKHIQPIGVAGKSVHQEVSILKYLSMVESAADRELFDRAETERVNFQ